MADSSGVSFNIGCVKSRLYGPTAQPPYQTTAKCSLFDRRKFLLQFKLQKNLKSELPLLRFNPLGRPDRIEIAKRAHVTLAPIPVLRKQSAEFGVIEANKDGRVLALHKKERQCAQPSLRSTKVYASRGGTLSPPSALLSGGMVRDSILGRSIRVHTGAHVEGCVIMDNCDIGRHAKVRRAILGKRTFGFPKAP